MAGDRKGELDRYNCHRLADRMAQGDDSTEWTDWEDPRSHLVTQPVRWVRDLSPEWMALEEVPQVAGLWEHFARIFRTWGYSVWTGDLLAADFGVPQTRLRRILMGHKGMTVLPPMPTHTEDPQGLDLFGGHLLPHVSMRDALGWGFDVPSATVSSGGASTGGWEPFANAKYRERLRWVLRASNNAHACIRHEDEPAPTILFGHAANDVRWYPEGTTEAGRPQPAGTRHPDSRRLTVVEAGILQSFPADYPWQGTQSKGGEQVGNAIPPLLAAHILAALGAGQLQERAA